MRSRFRHQRTGSFSLTVNLWALLPPNLSHRMCSWSSSTFEPLHVTKASVPSSSHHFLLSALARSQPLRLRVLAVNERAQAFYRRHGFHEAFRTAERVFMEAKPNPSIERTSQRPLRALCAAAHVER